MRVVEALDSRSVKSIEISTNHSYGTYTIRNSSPIVTTSISCIVGDAKDMRFAYTSNNRCADKKHWSATHCDEMRCPSSRKMYLIS